MRDIAVNGVTTSSLLGVRLWLVDADGVTVLAAAHHLLVSRFKLQACSVAASACVTYLLSLTRTAKYLTVASTSDVVSRQLQSFTNQCTTVFDYRFPVHEIAHSSRQ